MDVRLAGACNAARQVNAEISAQQEASAAAGAASGGRTSALSMLSGGRLFTLAWTAASISASAPYLRWQAPRHFAGRARLLGSIL